MYVAVCFAGVERHLVILEEEKKKTAVLKELLQQYFKLESAASTFYPASIRENMELLEKMEKSINCRILFLISLVDDFKKQTELDKEIWDKLECRLREMI